jgi:non-specific serine/threonine protein kinase
MLETVREFAAERVAASGEAGAVRRRHAAYFLGLAEAEPTDAAANQRWLTLLDAEYANVRAALAWSHSDPDGEIERRLVAALGWFWFNAGYLGEGRDWLEGALARPGWDDATPTRAQALLGLGRLAWDQGDLVTARPVLEQSVALCRQTGNARGLGWALTVLGQVALGEGDPTAARTMAAAGVAQLRTVGEPFGLVIAVAFRGWAALADGDRPLARTCFEESLALSRAAGAEGYAANVLRGLGYIALADGAADQAATHFGESFVRNREPRERRAAAGCVAALAGVALARGQPERAARLLGVATAVLEAAGIPRLYPFDQPSYNRTRTAARAALGEAAFAAAEAAGRGLTPEEALAEALLAGVASPSPASSVGTLIVPRTPSAAPSVALSERELEVLRLLAAGKSNPEIAETLVISRNTVYRHVNHIFTKLGVQNRTEAATLAHRQGLV